ncbi:MAG TPA: alpha/beta hydrolase [Caulifigura sp.]|nr:alpha/beta hydrolase [Caulifigura sp.]
MRPVSILLSIATLLSVLVAQAVAAEPVQKNIEYARVGERVLALDLYSPDAKDPAPAIVWIHGGAWRSGSKDDVPVKRWIESGFAIASVDYRLSPEAPFPAQAHDIKSAIRYLQAHARGLRIDPDRIVIAGSSAGAHLAALVGVSNGVPELEGSIGTPATKPAQVRAIVSFFGASNLQTILSQSTEHGLSVRVPALKLLLGGSQDEKSDLAKLASPVAHVDANDPPLWLIHGDADPQMPIEQSRELESKYRSAGRLVTFEVIVGGKHGGKEFFEDARLDRLAVALKSSLFP